MKVPFLSLHDVTAKYKDEIQRTCKNRKEGRVLRHGKTNGGSSAVALSENRKGL